MTQDQITQFETYGRYHCSPEWHLAQMRTTPFAALVYPFALRISKNSRVFHGSLLGLAEYFGRSRDTIQRAVRELVEAGFLVRESTEPFQPSVYRVISHKEWRTTHPGKCVEKEMFPWSGEAQDELGLQLWNVSGGKVRFRPHQLTALRRLDLTDDQVTTAFKQFISNEVSRRERGKWHGSWRFVQSRFWRWITGRMEVAELERLGLSPFDSDAQQTSRVCR